MIELLSIQFLVSLYVCGRYEERAWYSISICASSGIHDTK
jgi:hypothetical protein